jgi:hypothetical protein
MLERLAREQKIGGCKKRDRGKFMNSDCEGVFVVAGGGINLLTWLLENPGEHTPTAVLEATVPDSRAALEEYVEHYAQHSLEGQEIVSEEVCNSMALAAYDRAHWLSSKLANVFGLAISASLVTNYEKHEEIHAYIS